MNEKNVIVGLDVGTTKVCTIVGLQHANSELEIIGIGTHPSYGLKKVLLLISTTRFDRFKTH